MTGALRLTPAELNALYAAQALAETEWEDWFDDPDLGRNARAEHRALGRAMKKIQTATPDAVHRELGRKARNRV